MDLKEFEELWDKNPLVILDTNVLLDGFFWRNDL